MSDSHAALTTEEEIEVFPFVAAGSRGERNVLVSNPGLESTKRALGVRSSYEGRTVDA